MDVRTLPLYQAVGSEENVRPRRKMAGDEKSHTTHPLERA